MRFGRRKITYYDTEAGFEAEKFAARLLLLLMNEMRASGRRQVVFLCIGTDRSTGDSLGPLIGSRLEAEEISNVVVIGTLEHPVHAVNLDRTLEHIEEHYPDAIIIAVDAAVCRWDHVGLVTLGTAPRGDLAVPDDRSRLHLLCRKNGTRKCDRDKSVHFSHFSFLLFLLYATIDPPKKLCNFLSIFLCRFKHSRLRLALTGTVCPSDTGISLIYLRPAYE